MIEHDPKTKTYALNGEPIDRLGIVERLGQQGYTRDEAVNEVLAARARALAEFDFETVGDGAAVRFFARYSNGEPWQESSELDVLKHLIWRGTPGQIAVSLCETCRRLPTSTMALVGAA